MRKHFYVSSPKPAFCHRSSFTWTLGRQLTTINKSNGTIIRYAYNPDGQRTSKSAGGVSHSYVWQNGKLLTESYSGTKLEFMYDENGSAFGMIYNGTPYYYVKNLQGDVLRVVDASGSVVASYSYDAWGRILSSSGTLASVNPIRYRGYYYDSETGFYYLQSRYYDPEICRFINADNQLTTGIDMIGMNLFAYCGNNPVNRCDPSGHFWLTALIVTAVVAIVTVRIVYSVKELKRVNKELDSLPEPTKDISDSFRNTLKNNANTVKNTTKEKGIVESCKAFYNKVRNKGEWDLKQLPEYQGTFKFNEMTIQAQDIGNINFGYTGKALGLPDSVLLVGAGYAQIKAGTSNFSYIMASNGDDLRDQIFIMYGIILYNEDN